ncbi:disabled homolog 2-interacting protein-like [Centruroides vittatus]|uniref:disabled homolog 2-interacting protein-like n=1 Tax=Centruroides vittatus TaxID=120091 RepID=UPI0035106582
MSINFWAEDTSRPAWEMEAEILRLTTRLMMREREVRQLKLQLKNQSVRTQQTITSWKRKAEEKEDQLKRILLQKDTDMQAIVTQLMCLEGELRQEQTRINSQLEEKDRMIKQLSLELEKLRTSQDPATNERNFSNRAINDLTNVWTRKLKENDFSGVEEKKKGVTSQKTPLKMKDIKSKKVNSHRSHKSHLLDFPPVIRKLEQHVT